MQPVLVTSDMQRYVLAEVNHKILEMRIIIEKNVMYELLLYHLSNISLVESSASDRKSKFNNYKLNLLII